MFIHKRVNKSGSISVQVFQKIGRKNTLVKHIGTTRQSLELDYLFKIANKFIDDCMLEKQPSLFNEQTSELELVTFFKRFLPKRAIRIGYYEVFGKLYDLLNFNDLISDPLFKNLVIARIAKPSSKLATHRWINDKFQHNIKKDQIYRLMDKITPSIQRQASNLIYQFVRDYLNDEIQVVFFDATTLHFETFESDDFRKTGFSKVGKHNQPQIVIGLMVTREGLPIGYEVFPGNKFDGHTIIDALVKVKRHFNVQRIIFVADSGMLSEKNIKLIESNNYEFILGARLKSMSDSVKEKVLDDSLYNAENIFEMSMTVDSSKHRLIAQYSKDRARKDKIDRDKSIERIKKKLSRKNKLTKTKIHTYGKSKYIRVVGDAHVILDRDRIAYDEKWDGIKGYVTNIPELKASEVIKKYSELWQVEKAFRVTKQDLGIRPVYHFKRRRIRAHIFLVFVALVVSRLTEIKLKDLNLSTERIVENLDSVQIYPFIDEPSGIILHFRPEMSEINEQIYKALDIPYEHGIQNYPQSLVK